VGRSSADDVRLNRGAGKTPDDLDHKNDDLYDHAL
jgi:hypothetical protein